MTDRILEFGVLGCRMTLNLPTALELMPIEHLRKFFKWATRDAANDDSIRIFFETIPEFALELKSDWDEASRVFQIEYKDPRYKNGVYISDKDERMRRTAHNRRLMDRVKAAKARYERFQRKSEKLRALKDQYVY